MQIGDLFAKLGQGQTLSVGEIETLRLEMNNIQGITASISKYLDPAGGLTMPGSWTMLGDKTCALLPVCALTEPILAKALA